MTDLPETFDIPVQLREAVEAIRNRYFMALAFQMAEELAGAGLKLDLAFHVTVQDLRVATARLVVMACEIQKRQPRRDLWLRRAEEDLAEAQAWLAAMPRDRMDDDPLFFRSEGSTTDTSGGDHG